MHLSWLLALSGGAVASIPAIAARNQPQTVCDKFKSTYSNITYFDGDANYDEESEDTWSARSWLKPACIFAPVDAEQLSFAVTNLAECGVNFAIRGGGHMPIASANGIGSEGVLISCTNLDTLALSSDNKTLSVGPGPRWTEVYTALDGTGYGVVGARIGPVGVPGFLLGGGVSFYSYEHGLGSTNGNVKGYQCVLADGRVVEVTVNNEFADLFWALQGGGNSFCLVTRFDIQTYPSPTVMIGAPTYGSTEIRDKFMDTVFDFVTNGHLDPEAAIIPVCRWDSGDDAPVYSSTLFYNGNNTAPAILNGFLGGNLEPENGLTALSPFPLGQYSTAVSQAFEEGGESHGKRQRFHMLPILANREALQKAHDLFF